MLNPHATTLAEPNGGLNACGAESSPHLAIFRGPWEGDRVILIDEATVVVDEATLLPPVTLHVDQGTWHAVRGANGAGKSTLLALIAAVRTPTGGTITIDGRAPDARKKWFRKPVSALLSPPVVAPDLTLHEHLTLIATSWRDADPRERARVELERWHIAELGQRFAHELSSGQRQLFALATAFVRPSSVLVLDEPEQRLDAARRALLVAALRERQDSGTTIVMATHADDVAGAANTVTWLDQID